MKISFWSFIFLLFAHSAHAWTPLDAEINWSITQPNSSTYFDPTVEVSLEMCITVDLYFFSFKVCIPSWNNGKTLDAYGECRFMLPYPVRVCARTYNSASTDPSPSTSSTKTRICVFEDPMFPIDLNDFDGGRMKNAHNTKVDKSFTNPIKLGANSAVVIGFGMATGVGPVALGGYLAYEGIKNLIDLIGSTINYTVISNLGCVDIPFAPMPPFFTSTLPELKQAPMIFNICQKDSLGNILLPGQSKSDDVFCEFASLASRNTSAESSATNTFKKFNTHENPTVVLSFKNIIPKCKAEDMIVRSGFKNPECITIFNESTYLSNVENYMNSKSNNLENSLLLPLKDCSYSGTDPAFCIQNKNVDNHDTDKFFRPLCDITTVDGNFDGNYTQCSLKALQLDSSSAIVSVSAIDYSNFYQLPIPLLVNESVKEYKFGDITDLIDNTKSTISLKIDSSAPTKIQVFQKFDDTESNVIGTFYRPYMPKPSVTLLGSSHTNPGLTVSLGTPIQTGTLTYGDSNSEQLYLYLNKFTLDIIDKNNTSTLGNVFGNYRVSGSLTKATIPDEKLSKALQAKTTPDATSYDDGTKYIYMDGIEFRDNKYIRGGDYVCLNGYTSPEKVLALQQSLAPTSSNSNTNSTVNSSNAGIASTKLSDRIIPPYNPDVLDLGSDQFIETNFTNKSGSATAVNYGTVINPTLTGDDRYKINTKTQAVRNKLPIEVGLCKPIKQPECTTKTEKGAVWEGTKFGSTIINGKCLQTSKKIPQRLCQLKSNDYNTAEWSEIIGNCDLNWWPDPKDQGKLLNFPGDPDGIGFGTTTRYIPYVMVMTDDMWSKLLDSSSESNLYKSLKDNNNTKYYLSFDAFKDQTLYQIQYDSNYDYVAKASSTPQVKFNDYILMPYGNNNRSGTIEISRNNENLVINITVDGHNQGDGSNQIFKGIFSPENLAKNSASG